MIVWTAMVVALAGLLLLKVLAYLISAYELAVRPEQARARVDDEHFPAAVNWIDAALQLRLSGTRVRGLLLAFNAPVLVTLATATATVSDHSPGTALLSLLGASTAAVAICALLMAILRRLTVGVAADKTSDVRVRGRFGGAFQKWAVSSDGVNIDAFLYFFLLIYMSVVGFAGLYRCLDLARPGEAFSASDVAVHATTWFYFSATTMATVGFGDIHPSSWTAQLAVAFQIATGPIIIGWVLASLLTPSAEGGAASKKWSEFSNLDLDALYAGLEAADRDGSIDHGGKALLAEINDEYRRRFPAAGS